MKIVFFGNKNTTRDVMEYLIKRKVKIHTLVTLDINNSDKYKISGLDKSIGKWAKNKSINVYHPSSYKLDQKSDYEFFKEESFDLGLCTGWQRLIPNTILQTVEKGIFGWHGSGFEFPNGRGRSPINWSIRLGLKYIYHNCFQYADGVDNGKIYETKIIKIKSSDNVNDVILKAKKHICKSSYNLINTVSLGNLKLSSQPKHSYITLPKLDELDGELDINLLSINQATNIVRSCTKPFPGAFIKRNNNSIFRIWSIKQEKNKKINFKDNNNYFEKNDLLYIKFLDGVGVTNEYKIELDKN